MRTKIQTQELMKQLAETHEFDKSLLGFTNKQSLILFCWAANVDIMQFHKLSATELNDCSVRIKLS